MRTVVGFFLLFIFFLPCFVFAKPNLLVVVKGHYGVQRTEISKEASGWVCKTELTPYHFSPVQPYSDRTMSNIRKTYGTISKNKPGCRDSVIIEDTAAQIPTKYSGCADQIFLSSIVKEINRQCGRN